MKKEVSPIIGVVGILITLTAVMLIYWYVLVGGGRDKITPNTKEKPGGSPNDFLVVAAGDLVGTLAGGAEPGYRDGRASESLFNGPSAIAADREGAVYVADSRNHAIRKIAADGLVSTLAGTTTAGFADGVGAAARFSGPAGIALASDGSLLVADTGNHRLRRVSPAGAVSTVAGSETPKDDLGRASGGYRDGAAAQAQFRYPVGLAVDGAGTIYVADAGNHCVRRITGAGQVSTLATSGKMDSPTEIALAGGKLWVSDTGGGKLWAGPPEGPLQPWPLSDKKPAPRSPAGLAASGDGLYLADSAGQCIFRVSGNRATPIAGGPGVSGYVDSRGPAARFAVPAGLAAGANGKLYIADYGNSCIRELTPEAKTQEGR